MIELLLGDSREGKSLLAFDRALTECRDRNRTVIIFSYKETIDAIMPRFDLSFLENRIRVGNFAYFNTYGFVADDANNDYLTIVSIIRQMERDCCWPDVVVIDLKWVLNNFKKISDMERFMPDKLYIITATKKEVVQCLENYNLNKLLKES